MGITRDVLRLDGVGPVMVQWAAHKVTSICGTLAIVAVIRRQSMVDAQRGNSGEEPRTVRHPTHVRDNYESCACV